jgi:hypothetical protein
LTTVRCGRHWICRTTLEKALGIDKKGPPSVAMDKVDHRETQHLGKFQHIKGGPAADAEPAAVG